MNGADKNERIAGLVMQLHKKTLAVQERALADMGLTSGDYKLMLAVYRAGEPVTQQDIARAVGVDKAQITRQLASAEQKGLIKRETNAKSRREKLVALTKASEKLIPALLKRHAGAMEALFRSIPEEKLEIFADVIEAVIKNTDDINFKA